MCSQGYITQLKNQPNSTNTGDCALYSMLYNVHDSTIQSNVHYVQKSISYRLYTNVKNQNVQISYYLIRCKKGCT